MCAPLPAVASGPLRARTLQLRCLPHLPILGAVCSPLPNPVRSRTQGPAGSRREGSRDLRILDSGEQRVGAECGVPGVCTAMDAWVPEGRGLDSLFPGPWGTGNGRPRFPKGQGTPGCPFSNFSVCSSLRLRVTTRPQQHESAPGRAQSAQARRRGAAARRFALDPAPALRSAQPPPRSDAGASAAARAPVPAGAPRGAARALPPHRGGLRGVWLGPGVRQRAWDHGKPSITRCVKDWNGVSDFWGLFSPDPWG